MANVKFQYREYAGNSGYIWVCFYVNREKVHFSTKVEVKGAAWSDKQQAVTAKDPYHKDKNLIIESIRARINNVLVKYRLKDRKLTRETFLRAYRRPSDFDTFVDFARYHQDKISAREAESTRKTEDVVLTKLQECYPDMAIDELDEDKLDGFFSYLMRDLGNNRNTAMKNMTILKKFARAAWRAGYMEEDPFRNWKIQKTTPSITYLDEEELKQLLQIYESGNLSLVKHQSLEVFLFLAFSSLHIGDALALQLEQIGERSFTYYRKKLETRNPHPILVPVCEPLRRILQNIVGVRRKGKVLIGYPCEQTMNEKLKLIMADAGISKKVTLKVARHTFATIFLRKTRDLAALKEIMGHSEFRETLVYAHVMEESKTEGVDIAFQGFC
ncbi:MAG: site-specific integrase [Bacteroidaceae bacterium]|nr:site-specific integrase [Bacteroidaceae bacterium]